MALRRVLVAVAEGSEEIEAVSIIDTLRRAGAEVVVASVHNHKQVTCSRKTVLVADSLLHDVAGQHFDAVALPGGMPGAKNLSESHELIHLLKEQRSAGRLYAAICASPAVVLAAHGLLDGKKATSYPSFQAKLPDSTEAKKRVVVDGNCITSQGPGSSLEFSLAIVEHLFGKEKAKEVADPMLVSL